MISKRIFIDTPDLLINNKRHDTRLVKLTCSRKKTNNKDLIINTWSTEDQKVKERNTVLRKCMVNQFNLLGRVEEDLKEELFKMRLIMMMQWWAKGILDRARIPAEKNKIRQGVFRALQEVLAAALQKGTLGQRWYQDKNMKGLGQIQDTGRWGKGKE